MMNERYDVNCALYIRNACIAQDEHAPPYDITHLESEIIGAYKEKCGHDDWDLSVSLYQDLGCSGMDNDRPGLKRLLHDVKEKQIDVIAFPNARHIARSCEHLAELIEYFVENGVELLISHEMVRIA